MRRNYCVTGFAIYFDHYIAFVLNFSLYFTILTNYYAYSISRNLYYLLETHLFSPVILRIADSPSKTLTPPSLKNLLMLVMSLFKNCPELGCLIFTDEPKSNNTILPFVHLNILYSDKSA